MHNYTALGKECKNWLLRVNCAFHGEVRHVHQPPKLGNVRNDAVKFEFGPVKPAAKATGATMKRVSANVVI